MITGVAPNFDMVTPIWDGFLDQTFKGMPGGKNYVLDRLGYALSGYTFLEEFDFWFGSGGNGKGVLIQTVGKSMGSYYASASETAFTTDGHGGTAHPTELAELGCGLILLQARCG